MRGRRYVDLEEAKELYDSGISLAQVGAKFNVSGNVIMARFKEAGIPRRNTRGGDARAKKATSKQQHTKTRLCSCCGLRRVPLKPVSGVLLTRLCANCYLNASSEDDPHGGCFWRAAL